jgi:hypothetical protein
MKTEHIVNQIQHHELRGDNTLWVIGVISNPMRYHSRYRLFRQWLAEMQQTPCVKLIIVETAFGDREFEVTDPNNPLHLQLRTSQEIWHKESMINLGSRLLPRDWKYVAWLDCDIFFPDKNWAQETLHQLQHYHVVQPWRDCLDLGLYGTVTQHFTSWCYIHRLGVPKQWYPEQPYRYAHSGWAWACTRTFWENVGGLIDFAILGSADHHMAAGMIGQMSKSIHQKMSNSFKRRCFDWERDAFRITNGQLGFVPTRIEHKFHGSKKKRKYRERWQILISNEYDPDTDLGHDSQGLTRLLGNKPKLLNDCREYMIVRDEDSTEEN